MAESGIFGYAGGIGIGNPINVVTTTTRIREDEVAELDGRHMTFEERERERRERLEGVDLATQPVRLENGRGNDGGRTSADTGNTFGGDGGNNGAPVGRITMVLPTEWYMRQQAEDEHEQRETIHVGWSPCDPGK